MESCKEVGNYRGMLILTGCWSTLVRITIHNILQEKLFVTCSNKMSRMSKKIELVTSLERRFIKLSVQKSWPYLSQPKLLDAEHAWAESFKWRKAHLKFTVT